MKPERWNKVEDIFHKVLDAEAGRRAAVLEESCDGDEDLRREVESLLAQHKTDGSFIETPAFEPDAGTVRKPQVPLAAKPLLFADHSTTVAASDLRTLVARIGKHSQHWASFVEWTWIRAGTNH